MTQRSFCVSTDYDATHLIATLPQWHARGRWSCKAMNQNHELYKYLFQPTSGYSGIDTTIIDRVKDRYDALKRHPRVSRGDILRLDQHVEFIHSIERKIQVASSLSAPPPPPNVNSHVYLHHHSFPHDPVENALWCDLMTDIIASAFSTGVSRIDELDDRRTLHEYADQ